MVSIHCYDRILTLQSGSIINSWAIKSNEVMLEMSLTLAHRLNCTGEVALVAQCIRQKSAAAIQVDHKSQIRNMR
jgi:hypothetical protein